MQTHARVDPGNTKGRGPTAPGVTTHLGGKAGALSFSQDRTSTDGLAIYPLAIIGTRLVTFFFFCVGCVWCRFRYRNGSVSKVTEQRKSAVLVQLSLYLLLEILAGACWPLPNLRRPPPHFFFGEILTDGYTI